MRPELRPYSRQCISLSVWYMYWCTRTSRTRHLVYWYWTLYNILYIYVKTEPTSALLGALGELFGCFFGRKCERLGGSWEIGLEEEGRFLVNCDALLCCETTSWVSEALLYSTFLKRYLLLFSLLFFCIHAFIAGIVGVTALSSVSCLLRRGSGSGSGTEDTSGEVRWSAVQCRAQVSEWVSGGGSYKVWRSQYWAWVCGCWLC